MAELGLSKMSEPQPLRIKKWSEVEKEKRKKKFKKAESHEKCSRRAGGQDLRTATTKVLDSKVQIVLSAR